MSHTLDAAEANFSRLPGTPGRLLGMLLLTESARERVFEGLAGVESIGRWNIRPVAEEAQTLVAVAGSGEIAIVCGRQIGCAKGLEVLALGTTARYPEGCEPQRTIADVWADGAVPVLPWGFGKWLGRARGTVSALFRDLPPDAFFAGDNGGRLAWLGVPKPLRAAAKIGFRVLPGTDPFPFGGDYRRVGSFGFLAEPPADPTRPWQALRNWLEARTESPEAYGHALDPFRFLFNQSGIQVRNRIMRRGAS